LGLVLGQYNKYEQDLLLDKDRIRVDKIQNKGKSTRESGGYDLQQ
jgi:hypothetical protein